MNKLAIAMSGMTLIGLAGCMDMPEASRNAVMDSQLVSPGIEASRSYTVRDVHVVVPQSLTVSEANTIKPRADIVWRGDQGPDRHEQLRVLFEEAAAGAEALRGDVPVNVEVELIRFHGLTQYTRYNFRGDYDILARITVTDAKTGAILEAPHEVHMLLPAMSPAQVVETESQGYTERMFVQDFLRDALTAELS